MNAKKFYAGLYKKLENVTPLKVDCGKLCKGACCKGDGESGMYLFPHEEVMYDGTESWLKIYDSEFFFRDKPVKIAICNGTCDRRKRPLSCRIFPLFVDEHNKITKDLRAKAVCPLIKADIPFDQYDPLFLDRAKRVFNVLNRFKVTKEYITETRKIIEEYEELSNLLK